MTTHNKESWTESIKHTLKKWPVYGTLIGGSLLSAIGRSSQKGWIFPNLGKHGTNITVTGKDNLQQAFQGLNFSDIEVTATKNDTIPVDLTLYRGKEYTANAEGISIKYYQENNKETSDTEDHFVVKNSVKDEKGDLVMDKASQTKFAQAIGTASRKYKENHNISGRPYTEAEAEDFLTGFIKEQSLERDGIFAKILLGLGAGLGALSIGIGGFIFYFRRKKKSQSNNSQSQSNNSQSQSNNSQSQSNNSQSQSNNSQSQSNNSQSQSNNSQSQSNNSQSQSNNSQSKLKKPTKKLTEYGKLDINYVVSIVKYIYSTIQLIQTDLKSFKNIDHHLQTIHEYLGLGQLHTPINYKNLRRVFNLHLHPDKYQNLDNKEIIEGMTECFQMLDPIIKKLSTKAKK